MSYVTPWYCVLCNDTVPRYMWDYHMQTNHGIFETTSLMNEKYFKLRVAEKS